jgi:hypothetical protein
VIPYTTGERLALLEELERGEKIVLPISEDHAYQMLFVAHNYLNDRKQQTFDALTKEYK